jgi:hypothetical protein
MLMRPVLVAIIVLTCCMLGARWLWSAEGSATAVVLVAQQADTVVTVPEQPRQSPLQPFAARPAGGAESAPRLPPSAPDLSHVREFEFDAAALRTLARGDTLRVDFPPLGGRYELSVDEVVDSADERTIRGHIDYDRRQYPTLITLTGGWSFGSFTTPEGNFEFTARDGMARMVNSAELERRAYAPNHTLMPRRS